MRSNKYDGQCAVCEQQLPAGRGFRIGFGTDGTTVCPDHRPTPPARGDHDGWHRQPLASLDFETTGVNPREHRIVSFAALNDAGEDLTGVVNPGVAIPDSATEIHGITDADVESAPLSADGLKPVVEWVDQLIESRTGLVVFNAPFDLTLLRAEIDRCELTQPNWDELLVIDPLVIDWAIERGRLGARKLSDVAEYYGIDLDEAHNAQADAAAARDIAIELGARHRDVVTDSLPLLMLQQRYWAAARSTDWNKYALRRGIPLEDPRGWPFDAPDSK